jgi:hypothetical protein
MSDGSLLLWRVTEKPTLIYIWKVYFDVSLKRLLRFMFLLNYKWNYYPLLEAIKAACEEVKQEAYTHLGHTQWVAKNQSFGRLSVWEKNLGSTTMVSHQMIQIMIANLRPVL